MFQPDKKESSGPNNSNMLVPGANSQRVKFSKMGAQSTSQKREAEIKVNLKSLQKVLVRQSMLTSTKDEEDTRL